MPQQKNWEQAVVALNEFAKNGDTESFIRWCSEVGPAKLADLVEYTESDDDIEVVSCNYDGKDGSSPYSVTVSFNDAGEILTFTRDDRLLDTVKEVAYERMEGADGREYSLYSTLYDAVCSYKRGDVCYVVCHPFEVAGCPFNA